MAEFAPFFFFSLFLCTFLTDRITYKSWITPSNIIITPFYFILLFLNIFSDAIGYYPVSDETYTLLTIALVTFWGGQTLALTTFWIVGRDYALHSIFSYPVKGLEKLFLIMAFVGLSASLISYGKVVLIYGLSSFANDKISELTGTGVLAHLRLIVYPVSIYFFLSFLEQRKIQHLIIFFLCLISLFIYGVKYHSMFAVISIFFFLAAYKNINILFSAFLGFSTLAIFLLNYLLSIFIRNGTVTIERVQWVLLHLCDYIVGGVLVISHRLQNINSNPDFISIGNLPLVTIPKVFSQFIGGSDIILLRNFAEIRPGKSTNVATLFFDIYINCGLVGVIVWSIFTGFLFNLLFIFSLNQESLGLRILVSHIFAILSLSFFSNYYLLLSSLEYSVMILIITYFASLRLSHDASNSGSKWFLEKRIKTFRFSLIFKNG